MGKKFLSISTVFLIVIFFSVVNAYALTLDIGTNYVNQSNWTFTDGTNALQPLFSGQSYYEGPAYGGDLVSEDFSGWWQANLEFSVYSLSTIATPYLNLTTFRADDRAALLINGHVLQMVGIFGDSVSGYFNWTKGGVLEAEDFENNYLNLDTAQSFGLSGILQEGNNILTIIMNDTNGGIRGETYEYVTQNTSLYLAGNVEYSEVQNVAPVPEPTTILLLGTGLVGLAAIKRKRIYSK